MHRLNATDVRRSGPAGAPAPGSRDSWLRSSALRPFRQQAYRRLWAAGALLAFGDWMERLAVGWIVLDQTGSVFLTALSFAARQAPSMLFAPIGGALVDRFDRRRLLIFASISRAMFAASLLVVVASDLDTVWPILGVVALSGLMRTFEIPAIQTLITDIVGSKNSLNGISLYSVGSRATGVIGAMIGGLLIATAGAAPVFGASGGVFILGAAIVVYMGAQQRQALGITGSVFRNAVEGLRVMAGLPVVATLLTLAMVVEVLAFSYMAVMPSVARDVLDVGAIGLGALTTMAGVGGLIGSIALATLGEYRRKGRLILGATLVYGIALLGFSFSGLFALSLVLVAGIGIMAAIFDALQWTLLQANVPDQMRGRAIGGWVFAIGFGWIGHLELGALSQSFGVQNALALNGLLVATVALLAIVFASKLRRA